MAEKIEIPVEAIDEFSGVFKKAESGLGALGAENAKTTAIMAQQSAGVKQGGMAWTEFRSAYSTVLEVVRVGQQLWDATAGELDRYAQQVEKTTRLTGMSVEESSKMIQVADDLFISYQSLSQALTIAAKKQDLSVESIAKMADEYVNLGTAQEKAEFAAKKFGRGYSEVIKLLEVGGDTIRKMAAETPEALVLHDKDIERARAYRREIDAWNDSFQAVKLTVGGALLGAFNDMNVAWKISNELIAEGNSAIASKISDNIKLSQSEQDVYDAVKKNVEEQYYQKDGMEESKKATDDLAISLEDLTKINQNLFTTMNDFQGIADDYIKKNDDLVKAHDELIAKKEDLVNQGYGPESQALGDVNAKLDENATAMEANAEAAEMAVKKKIVALLEEGMMADSVLSEGELNALLGLEEQWGMMSTSAVAGTKNVFAAVKEYLVTGDIENFKTKVDLAGEAILALPGSKSINLDLTTSINGQPTSEENWLQLLRGVR